MKLSGLYLCVIMKLVVYLETSIKIIINPACLMNRNPELVYSLVLTTGISVQCAMVYHENINVTKATW